jgi:lipid-binding SYLF domain-containing protein
MRRSLALPLAIPLICCACSSTGGASSKQTDLHSQVAAVLADVKQQDPDLNSLLARSYGYAVFPSILKCAAGIDAAYGRGEVYQHNRQIGHAFVVQITVGAALGGQAYWQIVAFPTKSDLDDFRNGQVLFVANASGIAVHSGVGGTVDLPDASTSQVRPNTGLMFEAALGAETFWFKSLKAGDWQYSSR